jgi:hypothetical protein
MATRGRATATAAGTVIPGGIAVGAAGKQQKSAPPPGGGAARIKDAIKAGLRLRARLLFRET